MLNDKKITLRGLEIEDLLSLHEWMKDIQLLNSILRIKPSVKHLTEKWLENIQFDSTKIIFAIEHSQDKMFIGCVGANNINYIDSKAEIYIYIGKSDFRGKGLAYSAIVLFINYMFNYYNLHKLYLYVREDNIAAINLYKRVGFEQEGILKEEKFIEGKYINLIRMSIMRLGR